MKISEMILREEFYKINEETLSVHLHESQVKTQVYIYPKLNAIITKNPGKAVRSYLHAEYHICNNLVKRIAVFIYLVMALNSRGWLSAKRITVNGLVKNDELIYPCNRKYRIFYFEKREVKVMVKYGFPKDSIKREIEFRLKNQEECILPILRSGDGFYFEQIIDGRPLARVGKEYKRYEQMALEKLHKIKVQYKRIINSTEYKENLKQRINNEIDKIVSYVKEEDLKYIRNIVKTIIGKIINNENVILSFSHGDFQPGNIWIERNTEKIYIIDWESWGLRSCWYDEAVLKCNIRNGDGIKHLLDDGYTDCFVADKYELIKVIVAAEDLLYKLEETTGLPEKYGVVQFLKYLKLNYG